MASEASDIVLPKTCALQAKNCAGHRENSFFVLDPQHFRHKPPGAAMRATIQCPNPACQAWLIHEHGAPPPMGAADLPAAPAASPRTPTGPPPTGPSPEMPAAPPPLPFVTLVVPAPTTPPGTSAPVFRCSAAASASSGSPDNPLSAKKQRPTSSWSSAGSAEEAPWKRRKEG